MKWLQRLKSWYSGKPVKTRSGKILQTPSNTFQRAANHMKLTYLSTVEKILNTSTGQLWIRSLSESEYKLLKKQIAKQEITAIQLLKKINIYRQLKQLTADPKLSKWYSAQTRESQLAITDMIKSGYLTTTAIKKIDQAALDKAMRMLSQERKFLDAAAADRYRMFIDRTRAIKINRFDPNLGAANTSFVTASVGLGKTLNKKLTLKQIRYIVSHELDHMYRNTPKEAVDWAKAFDISKLPNKTQRYFKTLGSSQTGTLDNIGQPKGFNLISDKYHTFDELRARAGQLKDYISLKRGIPLNQDFTVTMADLNYAIKNYIKDTGLDNTMTAFFNSITNKQHLLKCMNKYALGTVGLISIGVLSNAPNLTDSK